MNDQTLYVLDMDRTLLDTSLVVELVERTCDQIGVGYNHEQVKELAVEKRGLTFEPLSFIKSHGTEISEKFLKAFYEVCSHENLVYEDAKIFLNRLDKNNVPYLILTFGPDEWQEMKLEISGLSKLPYIITNIQDKGSLIAGWKNKGLYEPQISQFSMYKTVIMVDDKSLTFASLPDDCRGYLIKRDSKVQLESNLPQNIKQINSLAEISI